MWRCFYFSAYHPFPTSSEIDAKIDQDAFERAVTLLAAQGTDLLGTLEEGDYFWCSDKDATSFHMASFDRVVRSATCFYHGYSCLSASLVVDVMDVLAMTQPQNVNFTPSADQLEPAARKLLDEGSTRRCRCRAATKDLSMLLSILLRMKLEKAKWGLGFHFGGFDKANSKNEKLARIMVEDTGLPMDFHPSTMDLLVSPIDTSSGISDYSSQTYRYDSTSSGLFYSNHRRPQTTKYQRQQKRQKKKYLHESFELFHYSSLNSKSPSARRQHPQI